ncbi:metal-dependent transcriptional regulator [Arcanobacterium ihumii]|uniref:metal-dependent transcriptional regulator n=1 Tax=Arcanobacterium ihumii TaxID=2138162 RepID=UPI000F524AFE|nr:metal-dependent transcriptional regulator [Arcanobacterium ihumii]
MNLSASHEDYLKTIWMISQRNSGQVAPKDIAHRLGLSPSTVSEGIKRLVAMELVLHDRYGDVALTKQGEKIGIEMVRKHRLIETFLVEELGYSWEDVHSEAESLEHAVSDYFINRIDEKLEFPSFDPHGDPIPRPDGTTQRVATMPLSQQTPGSLVEIARVADDDAELLSYVSDLGLVLGSTLEVVSVAPTLGLMSVEVQGSALQLPFTVADQLWVKQAQPQ